MKQLVFDIETNGLKPTVVWCIVAKEIGKDELHVFDTSNLSGWNSFVRGFDEVIGHNLIGYDVPVCERLLDTDFTGIKVTDTLVMSRLANPQRDSHSLDSYGKELNNEKGNHTDWSCYSLEMLDYCKQDVKLSEQVYQRLARDLDSFGSESISLEHGVQNIICQQIENGWLLDQEKCYELIGELKEASFIAEEKVHEVFKPLPTFIKEIKPKVKKDGTISTVGLKFLGDRWTEVAGDFSRVDWPVFNLASRQQIARYLQYFGWKPTKHTDKGRVIVSEEVLMGVEGIPEAKLIADYLLVHKRLAQVKGWLDKVDTDERVHGYVNSNGAVTGRMTHSSPNVANVPASYSTYGEECRSCWIVPKGYKLVGIDASGLELRMLAHYMDDAEYTDVLLNGDIHTVNMKAAGLDSRSQSKTFIYGFLYGAGDAKIGQIVNGSAREGKRLKEKFLNSTPALKKLREDVVSASERGFLRGLDKRKLFCRSPHSAVNTLLQGAGAIVMKKALCILNEYAILWGIDYKFVGNIHDEFQVEVIAHQAEQFGKLAVASIVAAGIELGLRCPLDGDYAIGNNWAETH
tara:strand:- start:2499 stop:4220 length:1722 start_codon:yes stop_codon:yes gene_type:complete